jgi:hypothetical protein
MRLAASTCARERQSGGGLDDEHSIAPGSKRQLRGSSIKPSVTPSIASHVATAARAITASVGGGRNAAESLEAASTMSSVPAMRRVQLFAGAPATIPS